MLPTNDIDKAPKHVWRHPLHKWISGRQHRSNKTPPKPSKKSPPPNVDWSYLKIPHISERLNHRITNIFWKEGIPVRVAHRSYTLRRALSCNGTERICISDNCPNSKTKLCLLRNTMYQITCNNSNQHYIGSTMCFIHDRVKQHLNCENSSVKKHLSTCKNKDYKLRHWNQDHCTGKWPRKSTPVWSILDKEIQTYPQILRGMQRIRGPFVLVTVLTHVARPFVQWHSHIRPFCSFPF